MHIHLIEDSKIAMMALAMYQSFNIVPSVHKIHLVLQKNSMLGTS